MREIIILFTFISFFSIGNAAETNYCDKSIDLQTLPTRILNPNKDISGQEKYLLREDRYQHLVIKKTQGLISSETYKKYLSKCQTKLASE